MSALVSNCPSCGGPIQFKSGQSIVVICEYCHSAVARTDRDLKDLGKVAELVETGSPLDVGVRGTWKDVPFELTGRARRRRVASRFRPVRRPSRDLSDRDPCERPRSGSIHK
ncbi:MAG TPA: hypothetical protein VHH35_06490, partial [Pyrinomonadaceae bacterium]|nr:hypothetical protein [Pyrinomonadaceae bacterium]